MSDLYKQGQNERNDKQDAWWCKYIKLIQLRCRNEDR